MHGILHCSQSRTSISCNFKTKSSYSCKLTRSASCRRMKTKSQQGWCCMCCCIITMNRNVACYNQRSYLYFHSSHDALGWIIRSYRMDEKSSEHVMVQSLVALLSLLLSGTQCPSQYPSRMSLGYLSRCDMHV
jgi:hypothetical protein